MTKKITKKEAKPKVEEVHTPEVTAEVTPPTKEEFVAGVVVSAHKYTAKKDGSAWLVLNPNGSVNRVYQGEKAESNAKGYAEKLSNN